MPREHLIPSRGDRGFQSAISPYPCRFQHPLGVQHGQVGHVFPHTRHALAFWLIDRSPLCPFVREPGSDKQAQGPVFGRRVEDRRLHTMELELFKRPTEHKLYRFAGIATMLHVGFGDNADVGFAPCDVCGTCVQVDESSRSGRGHWCGGCHWGRVWIQCAFFWIPEGLGVMCIFVLAWRRLVDHDVGAEETLVCKGGKVWGG